MTATPTMSIPTIYRDLPPVPPQLYTDPNTTEGFYVGICPDGQNHECVFFQTPPLIFKRVYRSTAIFESETYDPFFQVVQEFEHQCATALAERKSIATDDVAINMPSLIQVDSDPSYKLRLRLPSSETSEHAIPIWSTDGETRELAFQSGESYRLILKCAYLYEAINIYMIQWDCVQAQRIIMKKETETSSEPEMVEESTDTVHPDNQPPKTQLPANAIVNC